MVDSFDDMFNLSFEYGVEMRDEICNDFFK